MARTLRSIGGTVALAWAAFACGGEVSDAGRSPTGGAGGDRDAAPSASGGAGGADSTGPVDCIPYADTCPTGQYCQLWQGVLRCIDEGVVPRDEDCEPELCQRGSICIWASDFSGERCQQPCALDGSVACDLSRHTCFVATDADGRELDFGVCRY